MQCKISDPSQVPEFKYVPISTGATTLPFGTAPYVPTVQISQTKSDWIVVAQDPYIIDAKVILQSLAKCLNQHNFTIFDARDNMSAQNITLPLISHEETICELEFLERQRKGIVVSYQNRYKRKVSPVKLEGSSAKRPRLEVTSTSSATRMLLDLLSYGPLSIPNAAQQLHVKEKLIEQVVDVLMVVGQVTVANGLVTSAQSLSSMGLHCPPSPHSPKSPVSSCDESYGPIPETPPQSMPMWDSGRADDLPPLRPYATRSSTLRKPRTDEEGFDQSLVLPSIYQPLLSQSLLARPIFQCHTAPPPTQPAAKPRDSDRVWATSSLDVGSFSSINTDKFSSKSIVNELSFDSNLDLGDSSIVDFFQSSFWDQY